MENFCNRLQNSGALGRAYLFFVAANVGVLGLAGRGIVGTVFDLGDGRAGDFVCWAMLVLVAGGTLDALINDVLPAQYKLPNALRWRHLTLMGLAACFAVAAFMAAHTTDTLWVIPFLVVTTLVFMLSAFFDIRRRYRKC